MGAPLSASTSHPAGPAAEHGLHLVVPDPAPRAVRQLTVDRTVDRVFVHRRALSEVLLTDSRQLDRDRFVAAAQLPRGHGYFGDHTGDESVLDPILLFEVCRQAGLYASHVYERVPRHSKFILTHLDFERHHAAHSVELPCPLVIEAAVVDRKWWQHEVSGIDLEMALTVPDGTIGVVRLGLRYRSPQAYLAMRLRSRDGRPLESTDRFQPSHVRSPVAPRMVGRHRRENVIIGDVVPDGTVDGTGAAGVRGVLRVPAGHPSMFDHPQDHIPGMVLIEAARQLALCAAARQHGWPATRAYVDRMRATFQQFGELEPSTVLRASTGRRPTSWQVEPRLSGAGGPDRAEGVPVSVEITQDGTPICTAAASVAIAARHLRRRQQR